MGKRSAVFLINGAWETQAFPDQSFYWLPRLSASGKESTSKAGDVRDSGLIPGSARSHGKGHGNPLQYSCLENPLDRSLVGYSSWGLKELDMTKVT